MSEEKIYTKTDLINKIKEVALKQKEKNDAEKADLIKEIDSFKSENTELKKNLEELNILKEKFANLEADYKNSAEDLTNTQNDYNELLKKTEFYENTIRNLEEQLNDNTKFIDFYNKIYSEAESFFNLLKECNNDKFQTMYINMTEKFNLTDAVSASVKNRVHIIDEEKDHTIENTLNTIASPENQEKPVKKEKKKKEKDQLVKEEQTVSYTVTTEKVEQENKQEETPQSVDSIDVEDLLKDL